MIVTYLDTSALLRHCLGGGELGPVEDALRELPITSVLSEVEMLTAICARRHRCQTPAPEEQRLADAARLLLRDVGLVGLSAAVRTEAVKAADRTLIRSLDAIHVGTAVVAARQQRRRGNAVRFCTADRRQATAAAAALGDSSVVLLPELDSVG